MMDSRWSSVIMLMAFGVHFSCGGLQNTAGFIRYTLLQNADANETRYITWITSIYAGMVNAVAPIASLFVYKYGCRTSVIVGGTFETLGFVISYFARDKWVYFISYSFMSGLGSGLTFITALVILNFNFERYLSVASGISCSGQGIGLTFMPIITNFLFEKYGLQGTFLLLGGITLQKWIFGALMRPSAVELEQISKFGKTKTITNSKCLKSLPKSAEFEDQVSVGADKENAQIQEEFRQSCISDILPNEHEIEEEWKSGQSFIVSVVLEDEAEAKDWSVHVISGEENMAYDFNESDNVSSEILDDKKTVDIDRQIDIKDSNFAAAENKTSDSSNNTGNPSPEYNRTENKMAALSTSDENEATENKIAAQNNAPGKIATFTDDITVENETNENQVNVENASDNMADGFDEIDKAFSSQTSSSNSTNDNLYLKVLKIRKFRFFLVSIIFFSIPEQIIYIIFPNYFVDNGSNQFEVSYLLSILGISTTVSLFLMGNLANSQIVDIYVLFSMPFGILGVATLLLPFYVQTFTGRVFYVILFGLYNCSVYSLLNQIIIRITGIDNSTAAFGFVIFTKAVAGIFGPPLADAIAASAQDSNVCFFSSGCMYIICMLSMTLLNGGSESFVNNGIK